MFTLQTPPTVRKRGEGYGTLPSREPPPSPLKREVQTSQPHLHLQPHPAKAPSPAPSTGQRKHRGFASFGKSFFKLRSGKWSSSAPNLGDLSLPFQLEFT